MNQKGKLRKGIRNNISKTMESIIENIFNEMVCIFNKVTNNILAKIASKYLKEETRRSGGGQRTT